MELVKELARGDPWDIIKEKLQIKKGGLKYLEYMSVIVRLLDGHREVNIYDKLHRDISRYHLTIQG